jgi:putative ABC transport system permease protein
VTVVQANADLGRIVPVALHRYPPFPGFTEKMFEDARLEPALQPLKDSLLGDVSKVLWVLMGTVGIVLLIACANVTNLMIVRAQGRQQELAIRTALGAGWWQVARELLSECLAVGLLGGFLGLGLAYAAIRLLLVLAPANLPRIAEISLDGWSVLFTFAVSILAGSLFGFILSIRYTAARIHLLLRAGGRTMSQSREHHRARNTLVVIQVALALMLLISSGLMIRTFHSLRHVDPGFSRPEQLQTFGIYIPTAAVKDADAVARMEQAILDKVSSLPGVLSAAMTNEIPMTGNHWQDPIFAEDRVYGEAQIPPLRRFKFISPGLFRTMGNALIVGRDFTWSDVYEKRRVAVVSENLARELWQRPELAIGKRLRESPKTPWREVVGVVSNERDDGVDQKEPPFVFFPLLMDDFEGDSPFILRGISFMVRSDRSGSQSFVADLSHAVWSVNPNLPLSNLRTLGDVYNKSMARTSFALVMLAIAGATALLLGLAGIYGVVSYSVLQRTREVGIRRALGAQNAHVAGMFVGQAARLALLGIACGIAASLAVIRLMSGLLFDVTATDPITYAAVSLVLAIATTLAAYIPALRAAGMSPVEALRSE